MCGGCELAARRMDARLCLLTDGRRSLITLGLGRRDTAYMEVAAAAAAAVSLRSAVRRRARRPSPASVSSGGLAWHADIVMDRRQSS